MGRKRITLISDVKHRVINDLLSSRFMVEAFGETTYEELAKLTNRVLLTIAKRHISSTGWQNPSKEKRNDLVREFEAQIAIEEMLL